MTTRMDIKYPHIRSGVYVLRLEDGKFYVGESEDIHERFSEHDAEWTSLHEPIEVEDIFPAEFNRKELEKEVTLKYMKEHGWENVRGAGWTKTDMKYPPKALRAKAAV